MISKNRGRKAPVLALPRAPCCVDPMTRSKKRWRCMRQLLKQRTIPLLQLHLQLTWQCSGWRLSHDRRLHKIPQQEMRCWFYDQLYVPWHVLLRSFCPPAMAVGPPCMVKESLRKAKISLYLEHLKGGSKEWEYRGRSNAEWAGMTALSKGQPKW